jgi:adenosylcobinamide-phosphate synthase
MPLEWQILLAACLDVLLGDPRWFPHPVKLMGRFAAALEEPLRKAFRKPRIAGMCAVATVVIVTALLAWALLRVAAAIHPVLGDAVSVILIWTGIAARDLAHHSRAVWQALTAGNLDEARNRVTFICGRDTERLDETGIVRATVESVAENIVDGVTAPLFFAALGGPAGIMAYKAVSTLDSIFGYKNERYLEFGWASARLDDVAAFLPSRLTAMLVPIAAALCGEQAAGSLRILRRDRKRHPSPNAGQTEAAVAGALGVQLGGVSYYSGKPSEKPTLGDPLSSIEPDHIRRANRVALVTSGLALALFVGCRLLLIAWWV